MQKIILFFLFCFLPFTISGIVAQNQETAPKKLPNLTPKVPQEVIALARQKVNNKKAACFNNGTIEERNYTIVKCTSSVSIYLEYNVWFEVVNPCNDKLLRLWIQYVKAEDGRYVCTKNDFY